MIIEKTNPNNIPDHFIYDLDKIVNSNDNSPAIDNKGYICIREVTKEQNGLIMGILDGKSFLYEEKFLEIK